MCVGLSAKVVKISNSTAVIDAGGAKREVSSQLLEDLEPEITSWFMPVWQLQRLPMKMTARQISLWRNFVMGETNGDNKKKTAREIIENYNGPKVRIMEVCGTHTHEIFRLGIRKLLPEQVELISVRDVRSA